MLILRRGFSEGAVEMFPTEVQCSEPSPGQYRAPSVPAESVSVQRECVFERGPKSSLPDT